MHIPQPGSETSPAQFLAGDPVRSFSTRLGDDDVQVELTIVGPVRADSRPRILTLIDQFLRATLPAGAPGEPAAR